MRPPAAWSMLHGVRVALALPLWLRPARVDRLLATPVPVARHSRLDAPTAIRAGLASLRWLARLPRSPWRNTCLYRAVAACVLLRRAGVPARLRLGVGRGTERILSAHAWLEDPWGVVVFGTPAGRPLTRRGPGARRRDSRVDARR